MNGRQTVIVSSPRKMILEQTLPGSCWPYFSYVCKGFQSNARALRSAVTAIQRFEKCVGHPAHFQNGVH
jgi:hypothetical protein